MNKATFLVLLLAVTLLLVPAVASAQGSPPCRFYGTVTVDGVAAADGTEISAIIGNETVATASTAGGRYVLDVVQPEGKNYAGQTVTFMIGTESAEQTGTFAAPDYFERNLTVGVPPIIPGGGGVIKNVVAKTLASGANATATLDSAGTLTLGIPQGAKGDQGQEGLQGLEGDPGKDASNVIPIVAIVIAAIALVLAAVVMLRKKPA